MYQRIQLPSTNIGEPGPLPDALVGLTDDVLADLSVHLDAGALAELGLTGVGFVRVADPEPEPTVRRITRIGFLQRMDPAKRIAIRTAAKTDVLIEDFLDLLGATDLVELDHPDTVMGLGYLVAQGLLTSEDAEVIRA